MPYQALGRLLIFLGALLIAIGALFYLAARLPFLERFPGNLSRQIGSARLCFPLGICIVLSVILSILLNLLGRK